jgi:Trk K+ transport system NAD-binding subunit
MKKRRPKWVDAFQERRHRRNVRALAKYLALIAAIVVLYSILFGTLSTMTTLGLGDVVFLSEVGRLFTSIVLVSGILMVFVVLPYAFIQFFYTPWLEARAVPERVEGHVVIAKWDNIAPALVDNMELRGIPYFVLEADPGRLTALREEGVSATPGEIDDRATYERLRVPAASLVLANANDTTNTNVTLTVREVGPSTPIAAIVENEASVDILELAGATRVLNLKQQLGEQLANRMNAGHAEAHVIGSFRDLLIAEFPVHNTPFVGRTLRETDFKEVLGVNVVGVLEQAQFAPPEPDTRLTEHSYPVVIGTEDEIAALNEFLCIYDANYSPVLVIGGGKVGQAAARLLKRKGVPVNIVERSERLRDAIGEIPNQLFIGDAAERDVLMAAGLRDAPGVLLTTNDDAMNIYLAVYCRRLAPDVRIVSRITHDRNMEAIRRAGADLALSHTSLGVESVIALLKGRALVFLGEGIDLYELAPPDSLAGQTLAGSGIAARTGLNVIAVQDGVGLVTNPPAATVLEPDSILLMMGSHAQLRTFRDIFE